MEIPLNAKVACSDGECGRSMAVLINPVSDKVTHMVVKENSLPNTEYIVPEEVVAETENDTIHLRCSKAELEKMDPFVQTEYIRDVTPDYKHIGMYGIGPFFYEPVVIPMRKLETHVEHLQIPKGELAVRRGTKVKATDGPIGTVDEFMVDPDTGHITHLVMREGHLWGQRDVFIPISAISKYRGDTLSLNLDKQQIESLPTYKVHRHWA
jgi:hypothetical protein